MMVKLEFLILSFGLSIGSAAWSAEYTINTFPAAYRISGQTWQYSEKFQLDTRTPVASQTLEFLLLDELALTKTQAGMPCGYAGNVELKFKAPGPVTKLSAFMRMTNYNDTVKRRMFIDCSSDDGRSWRRLGVKEFCGGGGTLEIEMPPPENRGMLRLVFGREGDDKLPNGQPQPISRIIGVGEVSFTLTGTVDPGARDLSTLPGHELKSICPTSCVWAWEHVIWRSRELGMDRFEYSERLLQLMKHYHITSMSVNNLTGSADKKHLLALAEKYNIGVICYTDVCQGGFDEKPASLRAMEIKARRTVNDIGDYPSLLAYISRDEPHVCNLEQHNYVYELMKRFDPSRDATTTCMTRQLQTFIEDSRLPMLAVDPYYFGHDRSINIPWPSSTSMELFTTALENWSAAAERCDKHLWLVFQLFGDIWGRHYYVNGKCVVEPGSYLHWRMPTAAETRWQIWEGLRNNFKGFKFYIFTSGPTIYKALSEIKPGSADAERLAGMDRAAAIARGWKRQPLTEKRIELDGSHRHGCIGGEDGLTPVPQLEAVSNVYEFINRHSQLLATKHLAAFPVFFGGDAKTTTATFEVPGDSGRCGVVVNADIVSRRRVEVLLPFNTLQVVNLVDGKVLPIETRDADFKRVFLVLDPGDGAMLRSEFMDNRPGLPLCRENFNQLRFTRMELNSNAEIVNYSRHDAERARRVRLKPGANSKEPAFSMLHLNNASKVRNTFALNFNLKEKEGTIYCQVRGKLADGDLIVRAVSDFKTEAESMNRAHLKETDKKLPTASTAGTLIQQGSYYIPAVVPVGTTRLDFYLNNPDAEVDSVTVWFVQ
jgi:hypothetical protein